MDPFRRARLGLVALTVVIGLGTAGYVLLGFTVLDALYQTVTTVFTVGFREVEPLGDGGKAFTIVLIVVGVGTALWTLGVLVEGLVEGSLRDVFGRRRMERRIQGLSGHVIVCGYGRVGRTIADSLARNGREVVVVDRDPGPLADLPLSVPGDATDEAVLVAAGIGRAAYLVAALADDADNLFVTLSARSLRPELFIVARARVASAEPKLVRAGADRVVNPQLIGGHRMAAFVLAPHVAEFVDVVMHESSVEFRLEELLVPPGSSLAGRTIRSAHIRDRTGALVLALREPDGSFTTNPDPEAEIRPGAVVIAVGTEAQLAALATLVTEARPSESGAFERDVPRAR